MLSIQKMSAGSEEYYLGLLRYFIRGGSDDDPDDPDDETDDPTFGDAPEPNLLDLPGEPAGIWMGTGAERLGLSGIVQPEALRRLMQGLDPVTEEQLVRNAYQGNRCPGWDLTFSPPKSFDIVWSQAPPWMRQELEAMQQQAVREAIRLAEEFTYSRIGKGGAEKVAAGLVVAAFEHGTSRALDQKLHTHCLVLNIGVDEQGKTRTIASRPLFVHKRLLGAYYRAVLAQHLTRDLGFTLRRVGSSFEIVGVPQKLIAACSRRRAEVLDQLDKLGLAGGKAAAIAALETRTAKGRVPSRNELFAGWQARNAEHGFTAEALEGLRHEASDWTIEEMAQAIETATENLSQQQSHFTELDFLREVLHEAPARRLPPEPLLRLARLVLDRGTDRIVPLGEHQGQRRFTTAEILAEERQLLESANLLKEQRGAKVDPLIVQGAILSQLRKLAKSSKSRSMPRISPEQRAAIEHLTNDTLGTGAIRILQGLAGTGKTKFVLAVAHKAWTDAGYKVLAATPTAKAARVLQEDSDIESRTIALRLGKYKSSLRRRLLHDLRQLGRAARKRRTRRWKKPAPVKIDSRTILVVDEAGMVTTKDTLDLVQRVQQAKGTIVLTGDRGQLPPVGRGAPFQSLSQRLGCVELKDIKRQDLVWARQVALHASCGEVQAALTLLAENQAIRASDTVENAMQDLVGQWAATGIKSPREIAILANTNDETEALNRLCQRLRLEAGGLVGGVWMPICDHDLEKDIRYEQRVYTGDRVLFTQNAPRLGVENGSLGTVIAMRPLMGVFAVQLDTGQTVLVSPKKFPHIRLGYAMTTYKAQGETFPEVQVLITSTEQTLPAFYVQVTRAKGPTTIFTTQALWNKDQESVTESALAEVVARSPDLRLATDLFDADRKRQASSESPPALTTPEEQPSPPPVAEGSADRPSPTAQSQSDQQHGAVNDPVLSAASPEEQANQPAVAESSADGPRPAAQPQPARRRPRTTSVPTAPALPSLPYPLLASFLASPASAQVALPTLPNLAFPANVTPVASASSSHESVTTRTSTSERIQTMINQAAAEKNVPPDRVEIIDQREWDEAIGDFIRHWIEITYRITTYLPRDLSDNQSLMISRQTLTETWRYRSEHITALFLPNNEAAFAATASGSGRGASVAFVDQDTAREAIQSALTIQAPRIDAWLRQGGTERLLFDTATDQPVGFGFNHDGPRKFAGTTALRVVLQKHCETDNAFTPWTAYPLLASPQQTLPRLETPCAPVDVLRYFYSAYLTVPANFQNCEAVPQAVLDFREYESPEMLAQLAAAVNGQADRVAPEQVAPWFDELQLQHTLSAYYSTRPNELLAYVGRCVRDVHR